MVNLWCGHNFYMAATPKTPLSAHIFTSLLLHHPVLNLVFDQNRVCKVFTTLWRQSVEKTFHTLFWSKTRFKTNSCRFENPLEKLRAKTVPWTVCWPTTQRSSSSSGGDVVACPNPGSAISAKLNTTAAAVDDMIILNSTKIMLALLMLFLL